MKILCIGRNYADHATELGNDVPTEPVIFMKPESALCASSNIQLPLFSNEVHHEIEIVLRICKNGKDIPMEKATEYYDQIALGIDFTARDVQTQLKQKGLPWEKAKAFDESAYVSDFYPKTQFPTNNLHFHLEKNGHTVQIGNSQDLLFDFSALIHHCSLYFQLQEGDLLFTGTPKGVGKVNEGDELIGFLENQKVFQVQLVK